MDIQGLIEKHEDCFGNIGKLSVTHHITVNPDVKPVQGGTIKLSS